MYKNVNRCSLAFEVNLYVMEFDIFSTADSKLILSDLHDEKFTESMSQKHKMTQKVKKIKKKHN